MQNPSPSPLDILLPHFSWAAVNVLFCHVMLQVTLTKPDSDSTNLWVDLSTRMASLTSIRVMCSAATERPGTKRVAPTSSSWKEPHRPRGCREMRRKRDRRWSHETLLEMLAASASLLKCQAWKISPRLGIWHWNVKAKDWNSCHIQSVSKRVVVFAGNMCTTWSELHWICVRAFACQKCGSCWLATLGWNWNPESWQHKPQN